MLRLKEADGLTDDQIRILRTLAEGELQVDDLIEATQIPARRVLSALTLLELEEYVRQEAGKRFPLLVTLEEKRKQNGAPGAPRRKSWQTRAL